MTTKVFHITKESAEELLTYPIGYEFTQCGQIYKTVAIVDAGRLAQSHSHSWRLIAEPIKKQQKIRKTR